MIKKFITTIIVFGMLLKLSAAQSKITKYCEVESNVKTRIYFGEPATFTLKDTTVLQKLLFVTKLKGSVAVLDYMDKLGWTLVNIHAAGIYTGTELMYFKKEFDASEFLSLKSQ